MERLIKNRMEDMKESGESIPNNQYGFIKGRSTIDAILKVREIIESKLNKGLEVVAIFLDIRNAFNTIEWGEIKSAIKRKKLPRYLQKIIGNYLSDRKITWIGRDGRKYFKKVKRAVP